MKVRIFQAGGFDAIRDIEREINEWLAEESIKIQYTNTAMCQIADSPTGGERWQHLVVTVWYEIA